ncbi:MAG TPA: alpha/beta hydrolase [Anaerolineales bacterium]|nr:alpha/beta hydrolase [Anaerolineales bacterium]
MQKINVNGIELTYTRHGSGTPLVLLHGYPLDGSIWSEVVPLLADRFELIIPDLRGFGESTTVDTLYTMDTFASDVVGLLNHLGFEKTALAGHSMGGYVALAFAKNYPERVSGLGLVSSQAVADAPERKQGRYDTAKQVAEKGIGVVVEAMSSKFTPDERVRAVAQSVMEQQRPNAIIGALKAMAEREDLSALLAEFKFPVVLVHGDQDALIPIERAREVKNAIPRAQLVELKGVGHLPMLEAAEETAKVLRHLG